MSEQETNRHWNLGDGFCYPQDYPRDFVWVIKIPKEVAEFWATHAGLDLKKMGWLNKLCVCVKIDMSVSTWLYLHDFNYWVITAPVFITKSMDGRFSHPDSNYLRKDFVPSEE